MVTKEIQGEITTLASQEVLEQISSEGCIFLPQGMTVKKSVEDTRKNGGIESEMFTHKDKEPLPIQAVGKNVQLSSWTGSENQEHGIRLVFTSKGMKTKTTFFIPLLEKITNVDLIRASTRYLAERMPCYKLLQELTKSWVSVQGDRRLYRKENPNPSKLAELEVYKQELNRRFPWVKLGHVVEP